MLSEEKMRSLPPKSREFWTAAWAYLAKHRTDWALIHGESKEFRAWQAYFIRKGWKPFAIKQIETGALKQIVMPAQWPDWFESDSTYDANIRRLAAE